MMKPSENCIELIAKHEGFSSAPYKCLAGMSTIGFGSTYYEDNTPVAMKDHPITMERGYALLEHHVEQFAKYVSAQVKTKLTQNQFDALVSFVYNVGQTAFKVSTLLKLINLNPNDTNISHEFAKWNKIKGNVSKELTNRRMQEAKLYFN